MTQACIRTNERCLKQLIKARKVLQSNLKALNLTDVFKALHYCLSQGVSPIGCGYTGDVHRPSSTLELMPFINRKVSEANLELSLFASELAKRIEEISRLVENYKRHR